MKLHDTSNHPKFLIFPINLIFVTEIMNMSSTINITDIRLFNLVKTKFGEKEAEEFVALLKEEIEETVVAKHEFATKDIANLRNDLVNYFASREFVEKKISGVETKISDAKFQIILWAFVFWVTQLGAMFTFLKFFIK